MASLFQIRRGESLSSSLESGELYYDIESQSLALGTDGGTNVQLAKIGGINTGSFTVSGDITASNMYLSGDLRVSGSLVIGDTNVDTVTVVADFGSNLIPNESNTYNIGIVGKEWNNIFVNSISASSLTGSILGMGNPTLFSQSVDNRLDYLEGTFSTSVDSRMDLLENVMSGSKRLYVSPDGNDSNDGTQHNPFKTIKGAVTSLGTAEYTNVKRTTIFVGSGEYTEQNPIVLPPGVAIVGDTLRTVRLTAANPTKDFFHCHDSNYFYGLRFLDLKNPAFAFSFPCSTANATISGGGVSTISVVHSVSGYTDGTNQDLGIIIEGPDASGSIATATANVVGGVITQINVVSGGTNYTTNEKPHISIPAPVAKRPLITTSPYIQNCSSITGPFNTSGVKVQQALPYDIVAFNIDEQGAGGGIRIDGNLVHPLSPLESFVADAFTQVNQGGPGHLVINKGYAQFVSCFTTFCTYGFKVANGGFANISNSVIDFGTKGLISKTYYPETYNTALANESKYSSVTGFEITQDGAGYTGSIAGVTLTPPDVAGTQATAEAVVSALGTITSVYITDSGSGYTSEPLVTIDSPTGPGAVQATADSIISGVTQMRMILANTTQSVEISSNMILDGANYLVTNVQTGSSSSEKLITTFPNPPQIVSGSNVYFHKLSNISTGGLVMEYVGSGVTYNALPKFGGVPDRTKEIIELAPGRIFYSTVDNIGNLKIGEYFAVDQLTGEVTIDARNFNLSGINQIGPFRRNGISVGNILREVSDSVTLVNSQGVVGSDTVPTQYAVFEYVNNYTSSANDRLDDLEVTASNHESRVDILEVSQSAFDAAVVLNSNNVTILGNLTVQGTQTTIQSTTLDVVDKNITLASGSLTSTDANGAGIQIAGADVTMSWNHVGQRIELNKDFAVTGSISSSTISGIGNVTLFSQSVDSRLDNLETTGSNFDSRLDSIEAYTASVSTSVGLLETFSSSQYKNDSSSFDNRTDLLETTASYLNTTFSTSVDSRLDALETDSGSQESRIVALEQHSSSVNTYTASVSTSVGLLQTFSSSQYNTDSSSFVSRVVLLENTASLLNTFSSSQYKNDSSSFDSRIDSLQVIADLATSGSPVLEYETVGTLGNILIKGAASKSIQVVDSIIFTGLSTGGDQYSATGLLMTGSITASLGFSGSINGIGNVSEFSASIDSRIKSGSVVAGTISSSAQVNIYDVENFATFNDAIFESINEKLDSSSFNQYTSSNNTNVANLNTISASYLSFSQSVNETITTLSTTASLNTLSASIYSTDATQSSLISGKLDTTSFTPFSTSVASRVNVIETTYATTGSNTFIGTQTITGSLYISSDLIVQGSSSLQNITASAVNIGANIINLNTATPAIRYAGLVIADSGSIGGSGSFLYDSVQDEMLFIHRGTSTVVTSSVALMGPETYDNLGNETYLTANRLPKGKGNEHLIDSNISDDGTTISISTNFNVTGSQTLSSFTILQNVGQNLNFASDAAAASGGVPLYGLYRNGNFIMIRLT